MQLQNTFYSLMHLFIIILCIFLCIVSGVAEPCAEVLSVVVTSVDEPASLASSIDTTSTIQVSPVGTSGQRPQVGQKRPLSRDKTDPHAKVTFTMLKATDDIFS